MRQLLERYIKLEKSEGLRAVRIKAMHELLETFDAEQPLTLAEIEELVQAAELRQPVFEKLIYPILSAGVDANDIESIKLMVRLINHVHTYQSRQKEWKYDLAELVSTGLRLNPFDITLLQCKYESAIRFLHYSIHEVPWGVLIGNSSASEDECVKLLEYTCEVEALSQSLGKDDAELLEKCRYYYRSYAAYLAERDAYQNFAAYLAQHSQS